MLESRLVPAVTFRQLDLDGDGARDDVRIRGDAGTNRVIITDDGAQSVTLAIDANGDGDFKDKGLGDLQQTVAASADSLVLDIRLGEGNDRVRYDLTGDYDGSVRVLEIGLGGGDDRFEFNATGHDLANHTRLAFAVNAGGGADQVSLRFQEVRASSLTVQAALGSGNDTGSVGFGGVIDDGASVGLAFDLGTGTNRMIALFQGVGKFERATVDLDILGGNDPLHRDSVEVGLSDDVGDGQSPSQLHINAQLLAGNDRFALFLNHSEFLVDDDSVVQIRVHGGAGNDTLALMPDIGSQTMPIDPGSLFDLQLYGDAGQDNLSAIMSPFDAFGLLGTLRLRLDGGSGNDQLSCFLLNSPTSTGNYDLALFGRGGNDVVGFEVRTNQGTPTFNPAGALLSGGLGKDTLDNKSPAISAVQLFEAFKV